jgi:hypothetical protein
MIDGIDHQHGESRSAASDSDPLRSDLTSRDLGMVIEDGRRKQVGDRDGDWL